MCTLTKRGKEASKANCVRIVPFLQAFAFCSIGTGGLRFDHRCVSGAQRIELLEEGVREYAQLIQAFEADRALMLAQPIPSDPAQAATLAEALAANARALELLARALANIYSRLEQERSADTGGAP